MDSKKRIKNDVDEVKFEYFLNFLLRLIAQSLVIVIIFNRIIIKGQVLDKHFYILLGILVLISLLDKISYFNIPGMIEIKKISNEVQDTFKQIVNKVEQSQSLKNINHNYYGAMPILNDNLQTKIPKGTRIKETSNKDVKK